MEGKIKIAWVVLIVGLWAAAGLLAYDSMMVSEEDHVKANLSIEQLSSPEWVSENVPQMPLGEHIKVIGT